MSRAGTPNKSKDKIRNMQRREIVGTDIREQMIYKKTSNIFGSGVGGKRINFIYVVRKQKEKNECFYPS
jgi:hypothetical protein